MLTLRACMGDEGSGWWGSCLMWFQKCFLHKTILNLSSTLHIDISTLDCIFMIVDQKNVHLNFVTFLLRRGAPIYLPQLISDSFGNFRNFRDRARVQLFILLQACYQNAFSSIWYSCRSYSCDRSRQLQFLSDHCLSGKSLESNLCSPQFWN